MAKATKSSKFFDVSKSIFVGGLDNRVTEEMLWELFLQVGVTKQRLKLGMPANRLRWNFAFNDLKTTIFSMIVATFKLFATFQKKIGCINILAKNVLLVPLT